MNSAFLRSDFIKIRADLLTLACISALSVSATESQTVDFRYSPPEWQTTICLPDDPQKTLVDRSGDLLYHYNEGGREFGTRIGVSLPGAKWTKQDLYSPQVPVVRTYFSGDGFEMVQESFAVTDLQQPELAENQIRRLDTGGFNLNWAHPSTNYATSLQNIAVHMGGNLTFQVGTPIKANRRVALALCEGWWKEPGKRLQILRVEGCLPLHVDTFGVARNVPAVYWFNGRDVDGDGHIDISVQAAEDTVDKNTILNGLSVFPTNVPPNSEAFLSGTIQSNALATWDASRPGGVSRNDCILVRLTNKGPSTRSFSPILNIDTSLPYSLTNNRPTLNGHETLSSSLAFREPITNSPNVHLHALGPIQIASGDTATFVVTHQTGCELVSNPATVSEAEHSRQNAIEFWEKSKIPFSAITLPDPEINALVQSSIRNIWQAREIKNGHPVFQVGPTCYRGLWIVDGAFLLESATIVGAGHDARNAIVYTLSQQKPNGAFEVLSENYYKENGIVVWTCVRHAMLMQDKKWLESVWPELEKACQYIKTLRQKSLEDNTPFDDGINPPGDIDGGLWGKVDGIRVPEYSNVHWNLAGLHAFIQAARWLGKDDDAKRWQQEYDSLYMAFRKAAERDLQHDSQGNAYVPIYMANANRELPQRAQWTFCHAIYPGQIFDRNDPLVTGTLSMLQATEREGMVYGTGWDAAGIWNYFASFYGHAWLWQGNGQKAADLLYAFANHAAPTGVWREEQSLKGESFRKIGDMPHNWASAEFIRLAVHLVALDRGDELHLLEGYPKQWMKPGMTTHFEGVATPFGPLTLTVKSDGQTVHLKVKPLKANCTGILVHLPDGSTRRIDPAKGGKLSFSVNSK